MKSILAFLLELLRILVLMVLFLLIVGWAIRSLYQGFALEWRESYTYYFAAGSLLLYFVLYRDFLQFIGWYKSSSNRRLPKPVRLTILSVAAGALLIPLILELIRY